LVILSAVDRTPIGLIGRRSCYRENYYSLELEKAYYITKLLIFWPNCWQPPSISAREVLRSAGDLETTRRDASSLGDHWPLERPEALTFAISKPLEQELRDATAEMKLS
jgi:hypothetical protein